MRLVYRTAAVVTVVAALGVVAAGVVLTRNDPGEAAAAAPAPKADPVTVAATTAPPPSPSPVLPSPPPSPSVSALSTAMTDALDDPRVPELPGDQKKLRTFAGKPAKIRGSIKDQRSGVAFPRFAGDWDLASASPFASRQQLPKVKGSAYRGLLVSCPVPIEVQDDLKDTAFLAARWTLNHHPAGATLKWTSADLTTIDDRPAWVLGYDVTYTIKGDKRKSTAAIALVDVPAAKPALVFISIPDSQKKNYRDINTVMSKIKVL
ncbi:hypothetical protein FDA94_15705 [Herbidospora galbida]|uniref:Uncharacterized protein n=1 Tax=Herbidospora galbida TaxID=2575442 RepID=A0A4U3MFQ7_9ACTN|nr:hypothetical protein [Herbidospora galbida]TKK88001.1 hypothetical protein FDA94_15705 [Herbidospora galbida]